MPTAISIERWLSAVEERAAREPRRSAIVELDIAGEVREAVSMGELVRRARARARSVHAALAPGASVVVALPSGAELAVWMAACVGAGVRVVALHAQSAPGELRRAAAVSGAAVVVREGSVCDAQLNPVPELGRLVEGSGSAELGERGSIVLASSGSTGMPRLAERGADSLDADAANVVRGLGLSEGDSVLCIPPLCHSYGLDVLLGAMVSGATLNLMSEFSAAGAAAAIGRGITVLPGTPLVYEALARVEGARPRLCVSAGGPLPERVRCGFEEAWGVRIGQLYGATELGTVAVHRPDEAGFVPESIGRPLPGVSFRLDGEELVVRSGSMMDRYLDGEAPLFDGHFRTGDLARVDEAGRVFLTGRAKHLIDVGGCKVNPLEVEGALREHPAVRDCAVSPLPLSDTVLRLQASLVAAEGATEATASELRAFLRERLAPAKIPRVFRWVRELPRSPMGKLLRDRLPGAGC